MRPWRPNSREARSLEAVEGSVVEALQAAGLVAICGMAWFVYFLAFGPRDGK
jgi:hypothetical protein